LGRGSLVSSNDQKRDISPRACPEIQAKKGGGEVVAEGFGDTALPDPKRKSPSHPQNTKLLRQVVKKPTSGEVARRVRATSKP